MINATLVDPATGEIESGGLELVEVWKTDDRRVLWLDLHAESEEVETGILEDFNIHPLAMQDAFRPRHPPKIESFDNFTFILLRGLDSTSLGHGLSFSTIQLALFVGERWLVSRHTKASSSVDWLHGEMQKNPGAIADHSAFGIGLKIINRLVRRYVEILLGFEPRLEEIEQEMFDRPDDTLLAELTNHKARLREINRIARYHLLLAGELHQEGRKPEFAGLEHEITDVFEQVERTTSLASLYYDICKDLTDSYLALSSHNLNKVMQVLTVITVIFVPLTFIAGIYGMNFEYIPELGFRAGYFVVIGTMVTIAVLLLALFRRRGWV